MTDDRRYRRREGLGTVLTVALTATAGCLERLRGEKHRTQVRLTLINTHYENETTAFELTAKAADGTVIYEGRRELTKGHSFTTDPIPNEIRTIEYETDAGANGTVSVPPKSDCPPDPSVPREIELYYTDERELSYRDEVPRCD
ncbi:hypothetical protein [Natrinema sp. 1APR25-10V2]|uniref:hypothetical protein n=1 Tax=Natrinema sp. 1APR25-10V2 TaxID=2951081 RepID=UPI00287553EA|nr:hypothetical protein [Natrinema sp. 1APR25-10V2]MDS0475413.1 hypothetical protein [Natrinema sp. 1APR25-10V2]